MRTIHAGFKVGKDGETTADPLSRLGPTILVDIGLRSRAAAGQPPDLAMKKVRALIDTGAGGDCIDDRLAQALGLPITDEGEISGIGGKHPALIYTARVYVPKLDLVLFKPFAGVKLEEGEQWHRVILGRGFLRPFVLRYDGSTGDVTISDGA
jgi:hypothetical protein